MSTTSNDSIIYLKKVRVFFHFFERMRKIPHLEINFFTKIIEPIIFHKI